MSLLMLSDSFWGDVRPCDGLGVVGVDVHVLVGVVLLVKVQDVLGLVRGCNLGIAARSDGVLAFASGAGLRAMAPDPPSGCIRGGHWHGRALRGVGSGLSRRGRAVTLGVRRLAVSVCDEARVVRRSWRGCRVVPPEMSVPMLMGSFWGMFDFSVAWLLFGVDASVADCVVLVVEVGAVVGLARGCGLGIAARSGDVLGCASGAGLQAMGPAPSSNCVHGVR